jgi:heterodisulfide reductase subunit B
LNGSQYTKKYAKQYNLPILLYSQLLGLAVGADPVKDLGLNLYMILPDKIIAKAV